MRSSPFRSLLHVHVHLLTRCNVILYPKERTVKYNIQIYNIKSTLFLQGEDFSWTCCLSCGCMTTSLTNTRHACYMYMYFNRPSFLRFYLHVLIRERISDHISPSSLSFILRWYFRQEILNAYLSLYISGMKKRKLCPTHFFRPIPHSRLNFKMAGHYSVVTACISYLTHYGWAPTGNEPMRVRQTIIFFKGGRRRIISTFFYQNRQLHLYTAILYVLVLKISFNYRTLPLCYIFR